MVEAGSARCPQELGCHLPALGSMAISEQNGVQENLAQTLNLVQLVVMNMVGEIIVSDLEMALGRNGGDSVGTRFGWSLALLRSKIVWDTTLCF